MMCTAASVHPPASAGLRGGIKLTHLTAAPALLYLYPPRERGVKLYDTAPPAGHNPDAQLCTVVDFFFHSCFELIDAAMCLYESLKLSKESINDGRSQMFAVMQQVVE